MNIGICFIGSSAFSQRNIEITGPNRCLFSRKSLTLGEKFRLSHRPTKLAIMSASPDPNFPDPKWPVCVVLLAGGVGKRMKADRPKQFLTLRGKTILEHSINLFLSLEELSELVLVLAEEYREEYQELVESDSRVVFANPGVERQDSVYNGLQQASVESGLICIHDAARPLVTVTEIRNVLSDAKVHGASVLGVPCKATVKESEDGEFVLRTIPRSRLWEVQTPQVIEKGLLEEGFEVVRTQGLAVTDDVSIIEQLGKPVKLTLGEYTNIKITTPEDLPIAESILKEREKKE